MVRPTIQPPIAPIREIEIGHFDVEVITIDPLLEEALEQAIAAFDREIRIINVRSITPDDDSNAETEIITTGTDERGEIEAFTLD